MSVHLAISKQVNGFLEAKKRFQQLDDRRETAIEEVMAEAKSTHSCSTQHINAITDEINQLAKQFGFPLRKTVTKEMIMTYLNNRL